MLIWFSIPLFRGHASMWFTREEETRQRELEKLIDWELSKQLTWAVVFLTTTLGLLALLASGFLSRWFVLSRSLLVTFSPAKVPFVVIYLLLMMFGVDLSFYRLATSLAKMRNWTEMLPSKLHYQELIEKAILTWLYRPFVKRVDNEYSHRTWLVWLLIALGDLLLVWALVSV